MKYLFGPVNSRRLGLSLGLDLLPAKTCNFNCLYCEAGPTTRLTARRREYIPTALILAEFDRFLAARTQQPDFDAITITAAGEPTLHTGLGAIIRHIKRHTAKPLVVLTNGSLLHLPAVRQDLLAADLVVPSLDAARAASLEKVNRPVPGTDIKRILVGLERFRNEYAGKIWLEILLVKDINDSEKDIAALSQAVAAIRPDRLQLNTVVRPPCDKTASPLNAAELAAVARQLPGPVEIIADFARPGTTAEPRTIEAAAIINLLRRRPGTLADICAALAIDQILTGELLAELEKQQLISRTLHDGKEYYQTGN